MDELKMCVFAVPTHQRIIVYERYCGALSAYSMHIRKLSHAIYLKSVSVILALVLNLAKG